ncbi:MAG: hypothetical protein OEW68_10575 [Gammaproteobacteria bacterium]|nr:hypothetical protein [Gammaproteobacteria bacterium]MDH4315273.1 hypothetical protein [Gammaproteobacteria bacterium]MDH5213961.1 hypothetical protein [Gammaproteobacteria bacterium]MDH5500692.1 hypothetical protein [Gammaproteobacteria bacterium]
MTENRHYDTVAYDVRNDAKILFFARTRKSGDIDDYLLLMRADGEDFDDAIYIEMNENEFVGHDLIMEARMTGGILTLQLREAAAELQGATEIVVTYDNNDENRANVEAGVFRILGDRLEGGHA